MASAGVAVVLLAGLVLCAVLTSFGRRGAGRDGWGGSKVVGSPPTRPYDWETDGL